MVVDSQFHNLRDLSLALQELLRSHFPQIAPIQVFCMQMSHKLLVLVQHSARAMPDEQAVGQLLQTTLEHDPPSSIQHWLTQTERAQMELFLRVTGDNQVYASGMFDLVFTRRSPFASTEESSPPLIVPSVSEPSELDLFSELDSGAAESTPPVPIPESVDGAGSSPETPSPVPDENQDPALAGDGAEMSPEPSSSVPADVETTAIAPQAPGVLVTTGDRPLQSESALVPAGDVVTNSIVEGETTPPTQDRKSYSRDRWIAIGVATAATLVSAVYALSRPCVLGPCQNIIQAEALDATASATIKDPQSAQEVVDAYDQWVDASYLLQQIPPWSRSHAQAQKLLSVYEERMGVLNNVVQAQHQAYAAAVKSQNPPHPVDVWREIRILWQEAITLLQAVPQGSTIYPLAQQKLLEYEANLEAIDGRIETERAAQAKIQTAREAATVAEARQQVANSLETWQQTYATWDATTKLLRQVPTNTMSHAEAQQLLAIYQAKLNAARDRLQQETIAQSSYQQALTLADQAAAYEDTQQWSQAVIAWRDALNQAQQVPEGTTYHDQAQPLIMSYSQSLSKAEDRLRTAVLRQEAEAQLAQFCNTSKQCTSRAAGDRLQIQVTQDSLGRGSFPLPGTAEPIAEPFNDLLRSVAEIGQRSQVKIDVFNVDGSLFGTYTPDVNGYVPASSSSTPEPYRF